MQISGFGTNSVCDNKMREFTFSVEEEVRRSVLEDYGQLAIMEQTSWRQKSRALRIQEGDRNPIEWLVCTKKEILLED